MQELINKYFSELCSNTFFKNDDENIIGKAKDIIQNLKSQIDYANNPENGLKEEDKDLIVECSNELINQINNTYSNKDDVIWLSFHPMAGFFVLQDKETLYEELKQYYDERKV